MSTLASVVLKGVFASRPAASIAGVIYYSTDTGKIYRDNGSSWDDVTPSGGLTNPMTTAGDLIVGGSSGTPGRLAIASSDGQVLTRVAGAVAWAASGGGGATVPTKASTGFTTSWNLRGSCTATDTVAGVTLAETNAAGGDFNEGQYKSYPGAPFTIIGKISIPFSASTGSTVGFFIANSTSGPLLMFGFRFNSGWFPVVMQWSGTGGFGGYSAAAGPQILFRDIWVKLQDDGTNIIFSIGSDAAAFYPFFSSTKAASWIGASDFNQIGLMLNASGSSGSLIAFSLTDYTITFP